MPSEDNDLRPRILSPTGEPYSDIEIFQRLYVLSLDNAEQRLRALVASEKIRGIALSILPSLHHSQGISLVSRIWLLSAMGIYIVMDEYWPDDEFRQSLFYQAMDTFSATLGFSVVRNSSSESLVPAVGTDLYEQGGSLHNHSCIHSNVRFPPVLP